MLPHPNLFFLSLNNFQTSATCIIGEFYDLCSYLRYLLTELDHFKVRLKAVYHAGKSMARSRIGEKTFLGTKGMHSLQNFC